MNDREDDAMAARETIEDASIDRSSAYLASLGTIQDPAVRSAGVTSSSPLLIANLVEAGLPLVRNIVLARLISPTEFGLAISLSVVMGIVEVLTDLGLPVYAVGKSIALPEPVVMATVQTLAIARAAFIGLVLAIAAPILATLFGAPQATSAYLVLAAIAAIRGFEHFGVKALMRDFRFRREAMVLATAQVAGVIGSVALAFATRSFVCVLWGMATTSGVTVLMSHVLSPSPYKLGWNKEAARDIAAFSRPLLLNGLMVAVNLGDRLLIGTVLSPSVLALYNVAVGTATLPKSVLSKFLVSALLPMFVAARDQDGSRRQLLGSWIWCLSLVGFCYGFALDLFGREALGLVFGAAYVPSRIFMAAVAISICVKFLMLLPVPPAYADGKTRVITIASSLSAAAILLAYVILLVTRDLVLFAYALAYAELVGLLVLTAITQRDREFDSDVWIAVIMPFAPLVALAGFAAAYPSLSFASWAALCGAALAIAAGLYAVALTKVEHGFGQRVHMQALNQGGDRNDDASFHHQRHGGSKTRGPRTIVALACRERTIGSRVDPFVSASAKLHAGPPRANPRYRTALLRGSGNCRPDVSVGSS